MPVCFVERKERTEGRKERRKEEWKMKDGDNVHLSELEINLIRMSTIYQNVPVLKSHSV